MPTKPRLGIILASIREGRRGEAFARWIHSLFVERAEFEAELLDLKEWPLPGYSSADPPASPKAVAPEGTLLRKWADKIDSLDAVVVVTPEYNHGYPGALKCAIDQIYKQWNHKPIAFVSYGGFAAGARASEQLRQVAVELRMVPVRDEVNLALMGLAVDDKGWPTEPIHTKRAHSMMTDLLWWTHVTREGRANHPR